MADIEADDVNIYRQLSGGVTFLIFYMEVAIPWADKHN
jgi:hypothetical protein